MRILAIWVMTVSAGLFVVSLFALITADPKQVNMHYIAGVLIVAIIGLPGAVMLSEEAAKDENVLRRKLLDYLSH